MQFGLLGKQLSHSFSATFFNQLFDEQNLSHHYRNYEINDVKQFCDLVKTKDLIGLNVTIPYKSTIIPFLDNVSQEAKAIGAVNTIAIRNGKTFGYNTDVWGFEQSLINWLPKKITQKAVILGNGGSAKAVHFVLANLGFDIKSISRKLLDGKTGYDLIDNELVSSSPLWINTTPCGMYPEIRDFLPLPYSLFSNKNFFFDLIYNPTTTASAHKLSEFGVSVKNGEEMLRLQAKKSWEIWQTYLSS